MPTPWRKQQTQDKYFRQAKSDGYRARSAYKLQEIKRSRPDYLLARINLGVVHYSMGRVEEAIREWKEVLAEDSENKKALMYLRLVEGRPK